MIATYYNRFNDFGIFGCLMIAMMASSSVCADDSNGFYTIVDAQGRMITVPKEPTKKSDNSSLHKAEQNDVNQAITDSSVKSNKITVTHDSSSVDGSAEEIKKPQSDSSDDGVQSATEPNITEDMTDLSIDKNDKQIDTTKAKLNENLSPDGPLEFANESYIDSDVFEKQIAKSDKDKRFFGVPNLNGGVDFVEKQAGVLTTSDEVAVYKDFQLAPSYQVLTKEYLMSFLPDQCIPQKSLTKLKVLSEKNSVNLWPRVVADKFKKIKAAEYQVPAEFVSLDTKISHVNLSSFKSKGRKSSYYWPLPVFLDEKGCIVSGAVNFFTKKQQATWSKRQALVGNLKVPAQAKYIMLTPMSEMPKIEGNDGISLSKDGSMTLNALNGLR